MADDLRGPPRVGINPSLRRSYDLRGVFGDALMEVDAFGIGRAFAALAHQNGLRRIAVSRDGRLSSPVLEAALVEGLRDGGMHVFRMPIGPTPLLSYTIDRLGLDGGIMVTGSHNPANQNGFKLLRGTAPIFGDALAALWEVEPASRAGGGLDRVDISGDYLADLAAEIGDIRPSGIVWDSGNGATGQIVERLVHRLAGKHYGLHTEVDGRFPNHHPDPSVPENLTDLAATVAHTGSDLGVAFDGDGDRIGVVDSAGEVVWPDQLLLLLACDVLRERPGSTVVADVKSSRVLFEGIAVAGGRAVMGPSGYVLVRERMLREAAPIAGEMSGHIFFGDRWHRADDALYVAMRTIRALARANMTLRQFREALPPIFATPEIRLSCPDERKQQILDDVAARLDASRVDRTDGLRVSGPGGWWLLRASGTEPKLTIRCEGKDPETLEALKAQVRDALRQAGLACETSL